MTKYDFCGYVTKNDLKCTDGRVIRQGAFKHQDGMRVPLVWQHMHNDVNNVLGYMDLENRNDGVYGYGYFNGTDRASNAKSMVAHGDIVSMSIWANDLVQDGSNVVHGSIKEVSLVLAGANPGAKIENISFAHSDGSIFESDDEAVIHSGLGFDQTEMEEDIMSTLIHEDKENKEQKSDKTIGDVIDSMTEEQRNTMYAIIGMLVDNDEDDEDDEDEELAQSEGWGEYDMKQNVFDGGVSSIDNVLTHDDMNMLISDIASYGTLKKTYIAHAGEYGIDNIEVLFPDAKAIYDTPDFLKRRTEWVNEVLSGVRKTPFSRIKTAYADITADTARARGYIKGNKKIDEFFRVAKRETTPQTVYKKQKLDRDDILDITDFDVVLWMSQEMRLMLEEEIARAILIGDGRASVVGGNTNPDKIDPAHIRPIWADDDLYAPKVQLAASTSQQAIEEAIIRAMDLYEGTGAPTMFTTQAAVTDLLLMRDELGRRYYRNMTELADALGVRRIIPVDVMRNQTRTVTTGNGEDETSTTYKLHSIIVNLSDYTVGTDKGGEITSFKDFDIDYNQEKYLLETRMSGALTKLKSAVVVEIAAE